ncbi:AcrR family transcriptional regulator [Kitasatospora sp. MAP12-15]|uniref:TetR/AcrR family transcriptional regulator n=1 Tax=unclassified Kitasatospora TaxID=2633591 RepID=UPI00247475AF|nr:helix-turn-helix domain-containing protein [Kitasatospora sp. MAP12-44]MDH6115296.1 AcrR family transcriptional regulator [Kitasatospora sp. MAP12-44]
MTTSHPGGPAPTGTRALRRDAAQNRERLLRAAWEVFAELGPEAGVEEIARRAGVGMGTLYRRFPTKDALITALNDELLDQVLDSTRRTLAEQPYSEGLEAALWHMGAAMASHCGCLSRLWQALPPPTDTRRTELWALMGTLLANAQQAGTIRADLTLTDVYLCVLTLRSLIEDTVTQAPDVWRRYLAVHLAGFRPADQPLAHRPADDSLVATGVPLRPPRG